MDKGRPASLFSPVKFAVGTALDGSLGNVDFLMKLRKALKQQRSFEGAKRARVPLIRYVQEAQT
jgi:hypothetical protein